jgi:hypothetical protein
MTVWNHSPSSAPPKMHPVLINPIARGLMIPSARSLAAPNPQRIYRPSRACGTRGDAPPVEVRVLLLAHVAHGHEELLLPLRPLPRLPFLGFGRGAVQADLLDDLIRPLQERLRDRQT